MFQEKILAKWGQQKTFQRYCTVWLTVDIPNMINYSVVHNKTKFYIDDDSVM